MNTHEYYYFVKNIKARTYFKPEMGGFWSLLQWRSENINSLKYVPDLHVYSQTLYYQVVKNNSLHSPYNIPTSHVLHGCFETWQVMNMNKEKEKESKYKYGSGKRI